MKPTYDADALLRSLLQVQPTVAKTGDLRCGYCGRAVEGISLFAPKEHTETCRWHLAHKAVKAYDEALQRELAQTADNRRMVTLQILDGSPVKKVTSDYGITRSQAHRIFRQQVVAACRYATDALTADAGLVSELSAQALDKRNGDYAWVLSDGALYGSDRIVTRARAKKEIVVKALDAYWFAQETNQE